MTLMSSRHTVATYSLASSEVSTRASTGFRMLLSRFLMYVFMTCP